MIHLKFHTEGRAIWASTSADGGLRFADGRVWRDGESKRLASLREEEWDLGGERFEDIAIEERVIVSFQGGGGESSCNYGPFDRFETRDGKAYTGEKLFACYLRGDNVWVHADTGDRWVAMLIRRALDCV